MKTHPRSPKVLGLCLYDGDWHAGFCPPFFFFTSGVPSYKIITLPMTPYHHQFINGISSFLKGIFYFIYLEVDSNCSFQKAPWGQVWKSSSLPGWTTWEIRSLLPQWLGPQQLCCVCTSNAFPPSSSGDPTPPWPRVPGEAQHSSHKAPPLSHKMNLLSEGLGTAVFSFPGFCVFFKGVELSLSGVFIWDVLGHLECNLCTKESLHSLHLSTCSSLGYLLLSQVQLLSFRCSDQKSWLNPWCPQLSH